MFMELIIQQLPLLRQVYTSSVITVALLFGVGTSIMASAFAFTGSGTSNRLRIGCAVATAAAVCSYAFAARSFELRKLVGTCVMPAGIVWFGWAALAFLISRSRRPRLGVAAWCLWLAYGLIGNAWVGHALATWIEGEHIVRNPFDEPAFDAVLVLGGGLDVTPAGQLFLGSSGDRVMLGARLYRSGKVGTLLTSGPLWPPGQPHSSIPKLTSTIWQELGVPEEDIVLLEGPRTTGEELAALAELMSTQSWRRVGVLSSAIHLHRARILARRHNLEIVPIAADFRGFKHHIWSPDLIPQGEAFDTVHRACWEIVGGLAARF